MQEQVLVVVAREEDIKGAMLLLAHLSFDGPGIMERLTKTEMLMQNSDQYKVVSVENWWDGTIRGMTVDKVFRLTQLPRFVEEALKVCTRETD